MALSRWIIGAMAAACSLLGSDLESGRQAYLKQAFPEAAAKLGAALEAAQTAGQESAMLEASRLLAAVHRVQGDYAQAEKLLARAAELAATVHGENSGERAGALSELAAVRRAQGRSEEALDAIGKAIAIREAAGPRIELAKDLTTAATIRLKLDDTKTAVETLKRALEIWDAELAPGDPQCLPVLEALAGVYRDNAQYAEAEPLLMRALKLREAATGPDGADVISTVDSLAYVNFGLKRFAEAEVFYKRLLALWENSAGPEHPMVALTLDKMAEFYAFQQRYEQSEVLATQALGLRTRVHVASLNQTGRIYLMEAKLKEAEDLYRRTVAIADLARTPDDVVDPVLRIYAKVLRELKRDEDADALDRRVKEALLRKADREGRRPSPVKPQPAH